MRLQSMRYIAAEARRVSLRFPFAIVLSVAGCFVAWSSVGVPRNEMREVLLLSLMFGMTLFYALTLMNERFPLRPPVRPRHIFLAGSIFLAYFFYSFSVNIELDYADRYAQSLFTAFLFVSFAPYLAGGEQDGFWQFNKRLVLRYVVSAIYTLVLFGGVSLALTAIERLLGVKVSHDAYQYLWMFAAFIFWPLHFMSATPSDYAELAGDKTYPKGLKLFTQYVLIPLAGVYFLILYVYMGKILVTQQWPQGWVSWLTASASVLGLLTFLLLYPVRDADENKWIRTYSKGFCAAALPLLVMLFTAIYKRAAQYGITEHRYFLIILAAWLTGIFLYFIFSRKPNIKYVPVSLALISVLVSFGPWSAYSVSLASQAGRLEALLNKNSLLVGGKAIKLDKELDYETRQQISGCLDYVLRYHGVEPLKKYFLQDLNGLVESKTGGYRNENKAGKDLMSYMGQEYLTQWAKNGDMSISFSSDNAEMDTRGFDLAVRFHLYGGRINEQNTRSSDNKYRAFLNGPENKVLVFKGNRFKIDIPLGTMVEKLRKANSNSGAVSQNALSAGSEKRDIKVKAYFSRLSGNRKDKGVLEFYSVDGLLLIKEK